MEEIGIWFSQQDADMIHEWIQAELAKREQTAIGHSYLNGLSLGPNEEDMKQRMAYMQRNFVIITYIKTANDFCTMFTKHCLQLSLNELVNEGERLATSPRTTLF